MTTEKSEKLNNVFVACVSGGPGVVGVCRNLDDLSGEGHVEGAWVQGPFDKNPTSFEYGRNAYKISTPSPESVEIMQRLTPNKVVVMPEGLGPRHSVIISEEALMSGDAENLFQVNGPAVL